MSWYRSRLLTLIAAVGIVAVLSCAAPAPASAGIVPDKVCNLAGGLIGKACEVLQSPKRLLDIGKNVVTGHIGSAIKDYLGNGGASSASTALGLAAIVAWVYGGARAAFHDMAKVISQTAAPQLGSVWFSSTYWRMAAVAALLTVPFLFAAAVQALMRSDLALLGRAAFGYLPVAMLGVGIAAPITMLLLSATDELCGLVWTPSTSSGLTSLLSNAGFAGLIGFIGSPFLGFLLCLFAAAGAILVWFELAMREAAVYIVVLLLPLAFAALVWPARRVWATRAVELLVALILSKFAIVAVLGLGGTALSRAGGHGLGAILAGMVLVLLAAFAPWAVLRLVPLAELASGAAGALRGHSLASLREAWHVSHDASGRMTAVARLVRPSADPAVLLTDRTRAPHRVMPAMEHDPDSSSPGTPSCTEDEAGEAALGAIGEHEGERGCLRDGESVSGAGAALDGSGAAAGPVSGSAAADGFADFTAPDGRRSEARREERVPGAEAMWQAPDMSWRPLTLGPDDGWPPPPLWPSEGGEHSDATSGHDGPEIPDATNPLTASGDQQAGPLPPPQDDDAPL